MLHRVSQVEGTIMELSATGGLVSKAQRVLTMLGTCFCAPVSAIRAANGPPCMKCRQRRQLRAAACVANAAWQQATLPSQRSDAHCDEEMTDMGINQFYNCCCPVCTCRRCESCRCQWRRKAGCLSICKSPHAFPGYYQIAEADLRPVVETMLLNQLHS